MNLSPTVHHHVTFRSPFTGPPPEYGARHELTSATEHQRVIDRSDEMGRVVWIVAGRERRQLSANGPEKNLVVVTTLD
jgi:hypothetical protein